MYEAEVADGLANLGQCLPHTDSGRKEEFSSQTGRLRDRVNLPDYPNLDESRFMLDPTFLKLFSESREPVYCSG